MSRPGCRYQFHSRPIGQNSVIWSQAHCTVEGSLPKKKWFIVGVYILFVKDQIYLSGFAGHVVSITTIQLSCHGTKSAPGNM